MTSSRRPGFEPRRQLRPPRPGEILTFLNRVAKKVSPEDGKSGPQIRFSPCPTCQRAKKDDGSTVISSETGLWNCWACGESGNWYTLTRAFGEPLPREDRYVEAPEIDVERFAQKLRSVMRRKVTDGHHPELLAYCHARGITNATLDAWRVTTKGPDLLRWPIYAAGPDGTWVMVNARIRACLNLDRFGSQDWFEVKGGPTTLMIGNHLLGVTPPRARKGVSELGKGEGEGEATPRIPSRLSWPKSAPREVWVVEGQWDAMTAYQIGLPNVLSVPNGANHIDVAGMFRYVPEDVEVILAVDMDKQGDRCAEVFFHQLGGVKVSRAILPHKDLNDWLKADPGLTAAMVRATVKGSAAPRLGLPDDEDEDRPFLEIPEDMDLAEDTSRKIADLPWERLNRIMPGGLRAGQTTGLLAPSGVGKTTVVNQIAIHAALYGTKVGLISLEEDRGELVPKLSAQMRGWSGCTGAEFQALAKRLLLSDLQGTDVTWEQCMKEAERMIRRGAKLIVLDNLDYIMPRHLSVGSASSLKLEAYARFQEIMRQSQAHGIVVWQPNKVDREKLVNSGDQKGMSQALQDADNYLNLNKIGSGAFRRLEVEKCRRLANEDNPVVVLKFDRATYCLKETDHHADVSVVARGEAPPEVL